jgi:hypothetical protein
MSTPDPRRYNGTPLPEPERDGPVPARRPTRPHARDAVAAIAETDLPELFRFWSGKGGSRMPEDGAAIRAQVLEWMSDPALVEARAVSLGKRLSAILDLHLASARYQATRLDLLNSRSLAYLSRYDLEAGLSMLARHGLLVEGRGSAGEDRGARAWAVPVDLGDAILRQRRAKRRGVFDLFTLRGHLDRRYEDPSRSLRTPPSRLRELYKMYSNEAAAVARVERLEPGLRALVEKTVVEFGGILPRALFERLETGLAWDGRRWRTVLEESLLGTVERVELGRYGIHHNDETLIVFNEVALAWLRRVAVPGDPDRPHEESEHGVDLASNLSRFIGFILDHDVRFTVRGDIFKTTEKRIQEELIPNPGRELSREAVLTFIYGFARHARLIDSTGERTFALTAVGREWEPHELEAKLRALLEYSIEERGLPGEPYHQVRMRKILVRILKRVEPLVWYDLMYVPFLARNTYLSSLDELSVEECFASRFQSGAYAPMEDVQRLAWNLAGWVRQRLHLLGIVDLGYDRAGRPVALRLTRIGARLIGVVDGAPETEPRTGSLVVTPDFEVVLFPTGDDGELIHDLDRFCAREKLESLLHFRITERTVHRALSEGMFLKRMVGTLENHSRTPVPQNVLYSIRDWAAQAGLLRLSADYIVRAEDPEVARRFQQDPGVKPMLAAVIDERTAKLRQHGTPRRMQSLLRELGYLVELEE